MSESNQGGGQPESERAREQREARERFAKQGGTGPVGPQPTPEQNEPRADAKPAEECPPQGQAQPAPPGAERPQPPGGGEARGPGFQGADPGAQEPGKSPGTGEPPQDGQAQGPFFRTAADIAREREGEEEAPELLPDDARSGLSQAVGLQWVPDSELPPGPGGEVHSHVHGPTQMPADWAAAGLDIRSMRQQPPARVMTRTGETAAGPRPYTHVERTGPRMTPQAAPPDNQQVPVYDVHRMGAGTEEGEPFSQADVGKKEDK